MTAPPLKSWFKIKSAAEYADISPKTLRTWLRQGLKSARIGGTILIRREALDAFIEAHSGQGDLPDVDAIVRETMRGLTPRKAGRG